MSTDFTLSTLRDMLPKPLYDALDAIYQNSLLLTERFYGLSDWSATDVFSWNLQTILPPLISFLTIYFALISLYKTTTFFVRSTIFLVKWGAVIGAVGAALGYVANTAGVFDQSSWTSQPAGGRSRPAKPRAWHSFKQHRQWRAHEENQYTKDAGTVAREMVEKIIDVTQQAASQGGWWGTLAGMAAKTMARDDETTSGVRKRRLNGEGKGKIR